MKKRLFFVIDKTSKYYSVTERCKVYRPEAIYVLPSDKFRQVWRNHLFGESILLADSDNTIPNT